jgi:phospholipase C
MKRRDLLKGAAAVAGFGMLPTNLRRALALPAPTGGLELIEHVVVFMQENRSFDHYYGSLRGVRGFNDPTALESVFRQQNGSGYVLPYPVDDQFMAGTSHGWQDGHDAWNHGRNDQWVPNKGVRTMTQLRRSALPFYYALADAFTICDDYHCSEMGPTNPNRMYLFTGKIGFEPGTSNRAIGNDSWDNPSHTGYTWTSYAERLQAAGKSYRVYQEWDNYGDNSLEYFTSYMAVAKKALAFTGYQKLYAFYYALEAATAAQQQTMLANLAKGVATLTAAERISYDGGLRRERPGQLAATFKADVDADRLPAVSWLVAPESESEHPDWGPNTGANLVKRVLDAIAAKPEVWNKTLVLINYDENDGFFDHLPAPAPPLSADDGLSNAPITDEEYLQLPIGLGARVPMLVVSPWSRGGNVCSQVFDHTSVLQFLERWSGVAEPNISAWRRAVCGDLTSALDLSTANVSYPALPVPTPTGGAHSTNPQPPNPQVVPIQEGGTKPARPLPYLLTASGRVAADAFWIDMTNDGQAGAHFYVTASAVRTDGPWRYTVKAGTTLADYWKAGTPNGAYNLTLRGPNGFLRAFVGNRVTATSAGNANPEAVLRYSPAEDVVYVTLKNSGSKTCTFTVTVNNRTSGPWIYTVEPGGSTEDWFSTGNGMNGWYDLSVTADTADGFTRRFAGHQETGLISTTDPVMGSSPLACTVRSVDSQEPADAATNAIDGKPTTYWHTRWSGTADPLPHEIQLDLGSARTVTGLAYLPRQDGSANGRIGSYEVYLSNDANAWGSPVRTAAFTDDGVLKKVWWLPTTARYLRLRTLTEAGGRGPWTSAAELTPLGW